jgi:histone deacetylase 1/2
MRKGMDDANYLYIFKKITTIVMNSYRPDVVVLQSGADSLSKDRIGNFELTIRAYGECIKHMMSFNIPMVILGGGGYTIENVARCWAY